MNNSNNSHNAVIKGNINKKTYNFYSDEWDEDPKIHSFTHCIDEENLWEGKLDLPIMQHGDLIFLENLKIEVQISKCIRTTNNIFIYSTYHEIELIDDKESELKAEEEKREFLKQRKIKEKKEKEKKMRMPWFKRIFY